MSSGTHWTLLIATGCNHGLIHSRRSFLFTSERHFIRNGTSAVGSWGAYVAAMEATSLHGDLSAIGS